MQAIIYCFRYCAGVVILILVGCQWIAPAQNRYERIATAYCECTAQLAAINRQADTANPARLTEYFEKMQQEYNKTKECMATVVGQFGHLKPAELDTVNQHLIAKCPALADKRDLLQEMLGE